MKTTIGACSSALVPTSATVIASGAACNDANNCTQTDTCQAGTCAGNPVVCAGGDACHNAGVCNPANGLCSASTTRYNQTCNDGNACTNGDFCGLRLTQNFDQAPGSSIPAPFTTALAAGQAGDLPWRIDSSASQTSPLSAFADDPEHTTDKVLVTPSFTITSSPNPAYLTFYQRFQTENTFDGGVLEISINGGPFIDIVTAGGSFTAGGYTAVISPGDGSPIAGRQAWTGLSAGWPNYQLTTATFPPGAAGQSIRLQWRFVSDFIVPSVGQWIDSVGVVDDFAAMTCVGFPAAIPPEAGTIVAQPDKVTYTFPAVPAATSYDAVRGLTGFFPVGPGGGDEACGNLGGTPLFTDPTFPPLGSAYWYIARGKNSCGVGSYGTRSNGTPRTTATCP